MAEQVWLSGGNVVAVVLPMVSWLTGAFKESLLDWELERRTSMKCVKEIYKTRRPKLFLPPSPTLLFQGALPSTGWRRDFICCMDPDTFMILSLYHRTSHRGGH